MSTSMDCLLCYRVYIPEIDYSIEVPEKSSVYANSICKLLSIPFQPVFEEIFKDSSICIKCHRRFGEVDKLIKDLEVVQGKLLEFQEQIEVELLQSKKVGEIFDENETYSTTSTRCKLVTELKKYNALSSIEILCVQSNYNDLSSNELSTPNPSTPEYDHPLKSSHGGSEVSYNNSNNGHQQNSDDDENENGMDMASDIGIENEDDGYYNTEVLNYLEDVEIDYHIDGPNLPDSSTSNAYSPGIIKDVRIHLEPIQIPIETLRARSVNIHEEPLASFIARDKAHAQKLQNSHNFELSPMFVSRKRTKRLTNTTTTGINFDASLYEYNGNGEQDNETVCHFEGCYFQAKNPRGLRIHKTLIHGNDIIGHLNAQIKSEPLERASTNENESQNEMNEEGNDYDNDEFVKFMASNGVQTQLNEGVPQQFNIQRRRYRHTVFSHSRRVQEFRCRFCKKRLANKNSLSRHILAFHQGSNGNGPGGTIQNQNKQISKPKTRTCSICNTICPSTRSLIRHMKIHKQQFFCPHCNKGFIQQGAYDKHLDDEVNEVLNCENCQEKFNNKNCLAYHNMHVHNSRFLCTLCGKNFLKRYMFERHQKELSSSSGKVYRCRVCAIEFLSNACYRYHSRFIHPRENVGINSENEYENDEDSYEQEQELIVEAPLSNIEKPQMKITTEKIQFQDFSSPDNPLKCRVCQKILSSTSALQTHSLIHLNATPYKCRYLCGLKFRHIISRNRHEVKFHKNTKMVRVVGAPPPPTPPKSRVVKLQVKRHKDRNTQCKVCLRFFSTKSNLKIHTRHILVSTKNLKCRDCRRTFKSSACLLYHEKQHKLKDFNAFVQIKTENVEDDYDGSAQQIEFENIDQLMEQASSSSNVAIKLEKTNSISYSCPIPGCCKGFLFKSRLRKHILTHSNARPYVCEEEGCHKDFRTRQGLHKHAYDHFENKPYSCKICLRTFVLYSHLKRHLSRTHIKIQMEQQEKLLTNGNVRTKMISPSKNKINVPAPAVATTTTNQKQQKNGERCRFCNLTFDSSTVLTDHINLVHTSQRTYDCGRTNCGKSFKTSSMLKEHSKSHAKKSYNCEFCGKRLATEALYLIHRNLHTKEKSYTCRDESCGKVFYNPSTLYSHERSFHPKLKSLDKPKLYKRHQKVNQSSQSQSSIIGTSTSSNSEKKNSRANFETPKFFCGVCHEQFTELEVLEKHLKFKCKTPVAVK